MPATSILLKFNVHSLSDTYHAVGTSTQGSFNKVLGKGKDLVIGLASENELVTGKPVEVQLSLDGKYGAFTIRVYAENELGIRSGYAEVVKQVMGPSVSGTYSFGDVIVPEGEVVQRGFKKLVGAGDFETNAQYTIESVGTTVWTSFGASDNNVGTVFTANGPGDGTGVASTSGDTYDVGNFTEATIDFSGNSPALNWRLLAPPGHALEGSQLDSSMVKEDGFFDKFVVSFWRLDSSGNYVILGSDDDKMIDDIFGDSLEKSSEVGRWNSQMFSLHFTNALGANFSELAGLENNRKLLIKIEAHAIKFNANDPDKISHLHVVLQNGKTRLKTNFVETVANNFIFSYEAQDRDLSRVEVLQYRQVSAGGALQLVKPFGLPFAGGADKVQLGTIKAQQKWSNGRGGNSITNGLANIYKYVIAVYDSFGLSSAYAPKVDGGFEEKDSIADALTASDRTFESVVKIGNVTIADVADKFNISWSLEDSRGNGITFDNDSNSDFASVVSGVVGYFRGNGPKIVDAFKVSSDGDRFTETLNSVNESKLKQEYGVTLIPSISKEENERIQTKLNDAPTDASRSLNFTLKLLDSRGEVIDELDASGTNEQPHLLDSGESLKYHSADSLGSIRFDFKFSENIEYIKMFRKPRLHPLGNNLRYAQRSTRVDVAAPFGLTTKTPWAIKYNTEGAGWFGHYSGSTPSAAEAYAESMAIPEYWISDQKLSGPNSTETDPGESSATIVDEHVPLVQRSDDGFVIKVSTDITTLYDYVVVPYDTFGAGVPYLINGVEVIAYQVATKDDEGYVGFLDIISPQAPTGLTVKPSFNTFFLEWDPAPAGTKVVAYKVTMVRDSRPLKDRNGPGQIYDNDGLKYKGQDQQGNVAFSKWIPSLNNDSWAATYTASGKIETKAGVTENLNDPGIVRTRSKDNSGTDEFTKIDGHLYIDLVTESKMYMHNAAGTDDDFDGEVTIEEYIVETSSLAIEGKKNQKGYFYLEAIDRVGNHSPLHSLNGSSAMLGQSKVTDIFGFEQEITKKFPGSIVLVPSEPFSITDGEMSWGAHVLYSNGVGTLMNPGSIKMRPVSGDAGYEFLGSEVEINAAEMVDGGTYEIKTSGTTWTSFGAPVNDVGTIFVATGPGTGSGTVKVDKYIQSIYWDPAGGYDTGNKVFKSTADAGAEKANTVPGLGDVDEDIEYEKTGYYSFSVFNPASATYNLTDGGPDDPIQTSATEIKEAIFNSSPPIANYAFGDFIDYTDSGSPTSQTIDVTKFCEHWALGKSENDNLVKYSDRNTVVNASANVLDKIRVGYGIHMPLESRGEGVPISLGKRSPLVKPREKDVVGAIVVGRINLKPDMTFSVTSSWHAFANAVIGTAMIGDASIKTAHVNDISADILTAGEISGQEIILGERKKIGEPVEWGTIRSRDYGGIYNSAKGFAISGDGSFSFSQNGTSLSFDGNGLVLRGTLTQPDGRPAANIGLRATANQVLVSDFQVPKEDWTATLLSPDGGEVTIYGNINNAFDFNGNALDGSNIDVKVYPEAYKNAELKSFSEITQSIGPAGDEVWWYHDGAPEIKNLQGGDVGNLNDGISIDLNFGPSVNATNKFLKRTSASGNPAGSAPVLADYFSVEVRLKYANTGSAGNIEWVDGSTPDTGRYREGDFVVYTPPAPPNSLSRVYQALKNNLGVAPSGTSADTTEWKHIGPGEDLVVASDIFEINQLREASDALSFQLRANEGTIIKGSAGTTLDFTPWLIYGSTASFNLTEDNAADVWVQDAVKNIKIFREVVADPADFDSWEAAKTYSPGAVVKHNAKIYTCHTAPGQTATFNTSDWQEETSTEIYGGGDTKVDWAKIKLGTGATPATEIPGNQTVRDSFGVTGSVKFQNILFTMKQFTADGTLVGTLDTIKFTLLQDGNSAGELSFYTTSGRGTPQYVISRKLTNGGERAVVGSDTYFTCKFFEGATVLPTEVEGKVSISTGVGTKIKKTDITVTSDNGSINHLSDGTVELSVDDDNDVGRITLRTKLKNAEGETVGVGSEQIDIISVQPEHKAFRLTLKRSFIEFDGGSEAVNNDLLSPENIIPVQLFLGAENVVSKFNANDGVAVVPSFGWVASGAALNAALNGSVETGRVMPNEFAQLETALTTGGKVTHAIPEGYQGQPYYIYNDSGYKFQAYNAGGTLGPVDLASTNDFFFYIPDTTSDPASKKHGLSLKANYNRPAEGITVDGSGVSVDFEVYEDIEEINVMEIASSGANPFWGTSNNQNIVVAATADGNMQFGDDEGKADVNIYRGNKEIFLAPKRIQISTNGSSGSYTTFTLKKYTNRTLTISNVFEYEGVLNSLSSEVTHVKIGKEATDTTVDATLSESFEKTTNGNADTIRISKGGDSFHRKDNQKRHVLILAGDTVLQHGDFALPSGANGPWPAESKFSQTDFIAWPEAVDVVARSPGLQASSYDSLAVGSHNQRLTSNFDLANNELLKNSSGVDINTAGMITTVYIYDNLLGIRSKTTFERNVGMSKTGAPGPSFAYRGEYSPFKSYKANTQRIDVVQYTNPADPTDVDYYKAKRDNQGVAPTDDNANDDWAGFNELQSTATDLLLAGDVFVKRGIVAGIDRDVGTQQLPSFIASQLESRYYNLDASFDQLAMARIKRGIDFTDNGTPISNTHSSLESYLSANPNGESQWQTTGWYLDQTDWDYYIKKTTGAPPVGEADTDAWARNQFLASGNHSNIRLRESVPDSATDGTRSIRSRRSQKTYKTPNDKLPGFFLGFDKIDTNIESWRSAGVGGQVEEDFYVPKFELRSVFGNFLYWDGINLNIKGAIINASTDDPAFRQLATNDSMLALAGPANADIGGQVFIGGGFNNELSPSLDNLGSSIMGGGANKIAKNETAINPRFSVIGGGYGNEIHNPFSFIGGGYLNRIGGFVDRYEADPAKRSVSGVNSIVGGSKNEIMYSDYCAIGTGFGNTIQDSKYSTILNGYKNAIDGGDITTRAWLDQNQVSHWNNNGPGPDFDDDIFGGTTGVKCTVVINGRSSDPFEWKPFRHLLDGRAGEEEIRRFYKYAMSADILPYSEGVLAKDYNLWTNLVDCGHFVTGTKYKITSNGGGTFPGAANNNVGTIFTANGAGSGAGEAATVYDRNDIVQHQNKAWVCGAGNYPTSETSTGDTPGDDSDIWYDVTGPREYHETGDGSGWKGDEIGSIPHGAMGDPRFGKGAKWALDIGLDKETHYINGSDRLTGFQKFLKWEAGQVSSEQPNGDFTWDSKTWIKTVLPAQSNKNSSFSIFNDLKRVQKVYGHNVNNGGGLNHISIFDTGYTSGGRNIYIRALSKAEVTGRQFDIGYYKDDGYFYWIPIITSTWGWPIVKMEARGSKGVYGTFKLGDDDTIFWEPIGTPATAGYAGAKALMDVFEDTQFVDNSTIQSNGKAFKSTMGGGPAGGLMGSVNGTFNAPTVAGSNNAAQITPDSIITLVPEPTISEIGESWYNTIVGGDYNKIAKSRRSTIVGGRGVSLFQVERAIVGGLGNLLMGTPSTGGKLPKGFTVFGTENIISHESPDFIPNSNNPYNPFLAPQQGKSYVSIVGGEPSNFDALANTVFGSHNRARNSDRMTVLGSNNDVLFEDGGYSQTGSEITILGTDNKIVIGQDVDATNLGIFGTNFTLTQPAMVQNTFYIGNPKIDGTDLKALTRVFVAADGGMFVTGDVIAYALSDKKYKDNVKLIESPLDKLLKIRGVTFEWNQDQSVYEGRDVGVLANEVEEVLPEVVENRRTGKAVRYEKLTPLLIEAVKAQQEIIDSLIARVEALESKR
jgi:hypothetical protein